MATTKKSRTRTQSRSKSSTNKKTNLLTKLTSNKPALLIILGIALVGAFLLFRAGAATTSFEAEAASASGGATSAADTTASGGKYVSFSTSTASATASTQRFPGDPNPLVTGKAYWGAAVGGNDDPTARYETPTGKSLSLRRTFWGWGSRATSMVTTAKSDLAANRLPWISIKPPTNSSSDWPKMANGTYDAQIDEMLVALDNIGGPDKPVWLTVHHEPENDGGNPADWRAMQKHIRDRMNALKAQGKPMDNIAFAPILMGWTFASNSSYNPADWWVSGIWDFLGIDPYCYATCSSKGKTLMTLGEWTSAITYSEGKKIPIAIGEWGETNNATVWGQVTRDLWNYGFTNKKDVVGYSEFDSGLNPPTGTTVDTTMPASVLAVFQDILKNDQRVMRPNDLGKTTTTTSNYGTISANVDVPASGTYKVWVRMNAPSTTNNAVQLQVDNGTAIKVGDGGLTANTWTWVDWKNGNTADKTSMTLTGGSRKITLTGIEPGVKVDRVLITSESCTPTGTGDNCTVIVPPTTDNGGTTGLNVGIKTPTTGQTVTGTVNVNVDPATNVQEVSFRVNGTWMSTDTSSPFSWAWDTTKVPNGTATVTIRARAVGDPGDKYTEKSVVVTVKNGTSPTTQPVTDTTAPSKPANLSAAVALDGVKLKYVFNLAWSPSTDDVGVAKYIIERNGVKIGESTSTTFSDATGISADTAYQYSVSAVDAKGNTSPKASISVKGTCFLVWCSTTAL